MTDERNTVVYVCRCGETFSLRVEGQTRCEKCASPEAFVRAREIYHRAVMAFCDVLKADMHEQEALALADSSNTETGLFICDDGTGVGFVFHALFGKHLSPAGVKYLEEQASKSTIQVRVRDLLHGPVSEDPLTAEEREGAAHE